MAKTTPTTRVYPHVGRIEDQAAQETTRLLWDRAHDLHDQTTQLRSDLTSSQTLITTMQQQIVALQAQVVTTAAQVTPKPKTSIRSATGPGGGGGGGTSWNTNIALGQPAGIPVSPNLRWWRGNFSGMRVPGLVPVAGGSSDASLVFTPFIDRYSPIQRGAIYDAYTARGYTHFQVSWPDTKAAGGNVTTFLATVQEIHDRGFYPAVFLGAKGDDPSIGAYAASVDPVISALQSAGICPIYCVGWELNLWMSPTQVQDAINHVAPLVVPASNLYVHFGSGYFAYQQPGGVTADFWNLNVGKLIGVLFQRDLSWDNAMFQARIADGLSRFAGNFGFVSDSGFGHPFDYVVWENNAFDQFFSGATEKSGDDLGFVGICTVAIGGPLGPVAVQGFGNGGAYPNGTRI